MSLSRRLSIALLALLLAPMLVGAFVTLTPGPGCCAELPSQRHWFGTLIDGTDALRAVVRALFLSSALALAASSTAVAFGVAWGGVTALLPRRAEQLSLRVVDVLAAAPYTLVVIALMVILRTARPQLPSALAAALDARFVLVALVASLLWLTLARVMYARVVALRGRSFLAAARALGMSRVRVVVVHVLPHVARPLAAHALLTVPSALAAESFFSFLGFGVEAPHVSLGTLVRDGAFAMAVAPWTFALPAAVLVLLTVALHVLGAGLRDSLR